MTAVTQGCNGCHTVGFARADGRGTEMGREGQVQRQYLTRGQRACKFHCKPRQRRIGRVS